MSFQTEIPPVPTREQEREMIAHIEKNFLAQPYSERYMNEAVRTARMEAHERKSVVDKRRFYNFATGLLISGPFILPLSRLVVTRKSGSPYYYRPQLSTNLVKTTYYHQHRAWRTTAFQTVLWFFCGFGYSAYYTDMSPAMDEYYEGFKVKPVV
jgi:hypothetical protein